MSDGYLWAKTLHLVLIFSWFAGLFYLPIIFTNLIQESNSEAYARLVGMAQRLYRFMTILMVPAIALGMILWLYYGIGVGSAWMHTKAFLVLILVIYHLYCEYLLKQFAGNECTKTLTWFRGFNLLPILLMLLIAALVVMKPN